MDAWIESLWIDLEESDHGTVRLVGAVYDLLCLADCGLVSRSLLNERLDRRHRHDFPDSDPKWKPFRREWFGPVQHGLETELSS